jgi:phosphatidylglycerophosphate synthase
MIVANIFDFIDGKVAHITNTVSRFGAFWDSTLDRFSDITLFLGLIYLYASLRRTDYVMIASLAMMFSIMTSYARARAESLIDKCKVGFMERPERIVLFMIGAFPPYRMAAVLWVILIFVDRHRRQPHSLHVSGAQQQADSERLQPHHESVLARILLARRARHTAIRPLVIAILAFVWLTPPDWINDPNEPGVGHLGMALNGAPSPTASGCSTSSIHSARSRHQALPPRARCGSRRALHSVSRSRGHAARARAAARSGLCAGSFVGRSPRSGLHPQLTTSADRPGVNMGRALPRVTRHG